MMETATHDAICQRVVNQLLADAQNERLEPADLLYLLETIAVYIINGAMQSDHGDGVALDVLVPRIRQRLMLVRAGMAATRGHA